jgi:mono/diheme cytochrome c family protein
MSGQGREFGWGTCAGVSLLLLTFVCLAAPGESAAQSFASSNVEEEVTFTRDVAPILQENCVQCHRDGGWAPMSLETYEVASAYAPLIKYKTGLRDRAGAMPPWYVEKDIGIQQFKNDKSLNDEEIATIAAWVDAGAPQGDPADMPALRMFDDSDEWTIRPDFVVESEEFFMEAVAADWWGDIEPILIDMPEDRYVSAIEVREVNDVPDDWGVGGTVGGRFIVHHLVYGTNIENQDEDDERATRTGWPVHEVGRNEDIFDLDAGRLLRAGSEITSTSLHLHASGRDTRARLEIAFEFHPKGYEPKYSRGGGGPGGNTVNMDILPNETDQVLHAYGVLDRHTKIISYEPHLHAPGWRMCMEAIWGSMSETLSCVGYDHSWVRTYNYADDYQPLLPKGTILHIIGYMNNTTSNPNVLYPENWMGGGNRSVANMFLELGISVGLTDEEFVEEMAARRKNLNLTANDYVIGCPLCLAPLVSEPAPMEEEPAAGGGE